MLWGGGWQGSSQLGGLRSTFSRKPGLTLPSCAGSIWLAASCLQGLEPSGGKGLGGLKPVIPGQGHVGRSHGGWAEKPSLSLSFGLAPRGSWQVWVVALPLGGALPLAAPQESPSPACRGRVPASLSEVHVGRGWCGARGSVGGVLLSSCGAAQWDPHTEQPGI